MKFKIYLNRLLVCFGVFLSCLSISNANNIMGSYVGYEAIDSVRYKVTVILYIDCSGIPLNSATIKVNGKSTGTFTATLPLVSVRDVTASFLGCGTQSRCSGSFTYGFEERTFTDIIDISGGDCTYTFSYENCCRSTVITTGAASTSAYNYASVNKCAGLNTSPRPMSDPQFLLPQGNDVAISPTMMEFNDKADSVVFSLVAPIDNTGSPTTYSGSFTAQKPFTYLGFPNNSLAIPGGFHFDPVTGAITFRPTKKNEVGIYVVEAQEYRKVNGTDILVGTSRLELTGIIVSSANNKLPSLQATGISQNFCVGTKTCFSYTTTDLDINDSTFIQMSNTLPGALFYDNRSSNNGSGDFCWTPTISNVRRAPYLLTTTVRDNACPTNGLIATTVALYVNPSYNTSNHAVVSKTVNCNRASITASKDSFSDLLLDWKAENGLIDTIIGDSAVLFFKNTGWNYFGIRSKNTNGCLGPYEWDSVFITPLYTLQISKSSDTSACSSDTFQLSVIPLNGLAPYKYFWSDAPKTNSSTIALNSPKTAHHLVSVADDAGCFTTDSIRVAVSSPGATIGTDTSVCAYTKVNLIATKPTGIAPFKYEWLGIDTVPNVSATIGTSQVAFKLKISDSTGCANVFTKTVTPFKFSLALQGDAAVCSGDSTTVIADAHDGLAPYSFPWPTTLGTRASYTYTPVADSIFTVSITDNRGCKAYDTVMIKSNPPIMITIPNTVEACTGSNLMLTATVNGGTNPYMYSWNGGSAGISNTFQFSVNATTKLVKLIVLDSLNCTNTQNINITVLANPNVNAGFDNTICYGTSTNLLAFATSGNAPYNFAWSNGDSVSTTTVAPNTTTTYKVTVTDSKGCKGDDAVVIKVLPREIITITAPFQICGNYSAIPLTASKPGGTWSGLGIVGNTFSPTKTNAGKHPLYYTFVGSNGCPMQDTTEAHVLGNFPTADFTYSTTTGGAANVIQFTDASLGSPTSWQWAIISKSNITLFTSAQQNPSITFTSAGTYSVRLVVYNGTCYDTLLQKDYINITNVGIADVETNPYKIYPNPATTQITVEGENIAHIAITDMQGRAIQAPVSTSGNTHYFNVAGMAAGVYIITVEDTNHNSYHKKITVGK